MNNEVKKPIEQPQGYGPNKPEILNLAKKSGLFDFQENNANFQSDSTGGSNIITEIEPYCVGKKGENFHLDGVCERVLQCLGEKQFNYWMIAGVTGDAYTQVYPKNQIFYPHRYCVSDYHVLYDEDCSPYIKMVFEQLGHKCLYVSAEDIALNRETYLKILTSYIDNGIPVIQYKKDFHLIVGYEEGGNVLLCQPHEESPEIVRERFDDNFLTDESMKGWIFVGEKTEQKDRGQIYRDAVRKMAQILTTETDRYVFGAGAFRTWANDIQSGYYNDKILDENDLWTVHMGYVACYETISRCCRIFLNEACVLNPDMKFISEIIPIFNREGVYDIHGLDDLGAGFNTTLSVLQDSNKQKRIAEQLELFARNMDIIVKIIKENI